MKPGLKWVLVTFLALVVLVILYLVFFTLAPCAKLYYVRDQNGQCATVGSCSLPKGMVQDPSCKDILSQSMQPQAPPSTTPAAGPTPYPELNSYLTQHNEKINLAKQNRDPSICLTVPSNVPGNMTALYQLYINQTVIAALNARPNCVAGCAMAAAINLEKDITHQFALRDRCLDAFNLTSITECGYLSDTAEKGHVASEADIVSPQKQCYLNVALSTHNASICRLINTTYPTAQSGYDRVSAWHCGAAFNITFF